jgi:hypothetical protein
LNLLVSVFENAVEKNKELHRSNEHLILAKEKLSAWNTQLESLNSQLNEFNSRMKRDLQAAARMQQSLLPNEAIEESDPETQDVLLDSKRWRDEHERGVEAYAKARGVSIEKARTELARALQTPTASERRLYPKGQPSLQESVPLFRSS